MKRVYPRLSVLAVMTFCISLISAYSPDFAVGSSHNNDTYSDIANKTDHPMENLLDKYRTAKDDDFHEKGGPPRLSDDEGNETDSQFIIIDDYKKGVSSRLLDKDGNETVSSSITIKDPIQLEKIVEQENMNVPDGYKLVERVIIWSDDESSLVTKNENIVKNDQTKSRCGEYKIRNASWQGEYKIRNVGFLSFGHDYQITNKNCLGDRYWDGEDYYFESSWFPGPCNATHTYTSGASCSIDCSIGFSASFLTSSLKFEYTTNTSVSNSFNRPGILIGQSLNVKAYVNYQKWTFDVVEFCNWVDSGEVDRPVGVMYVQDLWQNGVRIEHNLP